jgi:hypothetical protein
MRRQEMVAARCMFLGASQQYFAKMHDFLAVLKVSHFVPESETFVEVVENARFMLTFPETSCKSFAYDTRYQENTHQKAGATKGG